MIQCLSSSRCKKMAKKDLKTRVSKSCPLERCLKFILNTTLINRLYRYFSRAWDQCQQYTLTIKELRSDKTCNFLLEKRLSLQPQSLYQRRHSSDAMKDGLCRSNQKYPVKFLLRMCIHCVPYYWPPYSQ